MTASTRASSTTAASATDASPTGASPASQSKVALLVFAGLVVAASSLGGFFTPGSWFDSLAKPAWNPPSWVFGPVWTLLYAMIAVAGWLVWCQGSSRPAVRLALGAWGVQLVLNALWSFLFFGLQNPFLALIDILALGAAIGATVVLFRRVRPLAAGLLLPYWAWVTFATVLNFSIWQLNG